MSDTDTPFDVTKIVSGPLRARYVGISATNPFVGNSSGSRVAMASHQRAQTHVLHTSSPTKMQSGLATDLLSSTYGIRSPANCIVTHIATNRTGTASLSNSSNDLYDYVTNEQTIQYRELTGEKRIGCIVIPVFHSQSTRHGYRYILVKKEIKVGTVLEEGELIADSAGAIGSTYNTGHSLYNCFSSHPGTGEDAVVFNRDSLPKFGYNTIKTFVIKLNSNELLLNHWGTDTKVQVLPLVGDYLPADGIIAVKRAISSTDYFYAMSPEAMRTIDYITDEKYQNEVTGATQVLSISVLRSKNHTVNPDNPYEKQLDVLASETTAYAHSITDAFMVASREAKNKSLECLTVPSYNGKVMREMILHGSGPARIEVPKLGDKKSDVADYTITIVVSESRLPDFGAKFTDLHASKGVISLILPPEQMPRDQYGRVADICKSFDSIVSRNIPGEPHEVYINDAMDLICRRAMTDLGIWSPPASAKGPQWPRFRAVKKAFNRHHDDTTFRQKVLHIINEMCDFYELLYQGQYPVVLKEVLQEYLNHPTEESYTEIAEWLAETLFQKGTIPLSVDIVSTVGAVNMIQAVRHSRFAPNIGPVTFENSKGVLRTNTRPIQIAPLEILSLEKDGSFCTASNSMQLQSFKLAAGSSKADKLLHPIPPSNVLMIAMDNTAILSGILKPEALAELIDRAANPQTRKHMVSNILASTNPMGEENLVNRDMIPFEPAPLTTYNHTLRCYGAEFEYSDDESI